MANVLTGLCVFCSRLPQGAPTSPALANLVFAPVDVILKDLADKWDCVYTRYADDLAFSGVIRFSSREKNEVKKILKQYGYRLNNKKCRIVGSGSRQILTGLIVNNSGLPPRNKRRKWRAMYHRASLEPSKYIGQSAYLKGLASFVNEYNHDIALEYFTVASNVAALEN